jgi:hypothetical protein
MPVVNDYTALLSGSYWNGIDVTGTPVIVTYSFPTSLPAYDASLPDFTAATDASFSAFTAAEQTQADQALGEWAAASGLVFIQVAPGQGDINFGNVDFSTMSQPSDAGLAGIGFNPFGTWNGFSFPYFFGDLDSAGDVFMNSQFLNGGTVSYATLLHEIGHAIGLKHPLQVETDAANIVHDQVLSSDDPTRTIMSTQVDTTVGTANLLPLDQQAAAFIYGPAGTGGVLTTAGSGSNAVSSWSWDPTTQTLTQTATSFNDTIRGTSVNDIIHGSDGTDALFALSGNDVLYAGNGSDTLYGGTGNDTLVGGSGTDVFYVQSTTTEIIENTATVSDSVLSTVSFALPTNVNTLSLFGSGLTGTANDQNDSLFGDGTNATVLIGGAGLDYIVAGSGNDTIYGGTGTELMYGGGGANLFVFTSLADMPTGSLVTTIGDFVSGTDKIDLSAIKTTGTNAGQPLTFIGTGPFTDKAGEVRDFTSGGNTFVAGDVNGDGVADFQIQLDGTVALVSSDFVFATPPCYCAGTHILTDRGERAVEELTIGDNVMTASGHVRPIIWIGHRDIDCRRHPDPRKIWPVLVRAEAFGENAPHRNLWLSPDHAVFVDGVLIPIRQLINGATIEQVPMEAVSYYHVELPHHEVLLAEGLPAESYLDTGNRGTFANATGVISLHPVFDVPKTWRDDAVAPLAGDEARVRPVWERLAARSRALGQPIPEMSFTDDPAVHLHVDGRLIRPVAPDRRWCRFVLPPRPGLIRLLSRSGYPTDARPWLDDGRHLGVYVSRIVWHGSDGSHDVPVDHPALREGWWDVERADHLLRRWTDGNALLPLLPDALMLEFDLAGDMKYRLDVPGPERQQAA